MTSENYLVWMTSSIKSRICMRRLPRKLACAASLLFKLEFGARVRGRPLGLPEVEGPRGPKPPQPGHRRHRRRAHPPASQHAVGHRSGKDERGRSLLSHGRSAGTPGKARSARYEITNLLTNERTIVDSRQQQQQQQRFL